MSVVVDIRADPAFRETHPAVEAALRLFQDRLNALSPDELEAVIAGASKALAPHAGPPSVPPVIAALTNGRSSSPAERVEAAMEILTRSFAHRRALLADAVTAADVGKLLGTSRQTPHDRLKGGSLLAVKDRGAWYFPLWQFDPEGEDGAITGLPAVIRALDVSPLAKVAWLTRANDMLDGKTPLECLRSGQLERVVSLARSVGVAKRRAGPPFEPTLTGRAA